MAGHILFVFYRRSHIIYRVSHRKGIDKKLLFGPAQGFNLVSDEREFLKQPDTEAFLKFDSCFSTGFER